MESSGPDPDWLEQGLAIVDVDGAIRPWNAAMRAWFGDSSSMSGFEPDQRQALCQGAPIEIVRGAQRLRLRQHEKGSETWLVATDASARSRLEALVSASSRLRLLGLLSGSVAHELAHRVGLIQMQIEWLADVEPRAKEAKDLATGVTELVQLAYTLVRQLDWNPREPGTVRLQQLAGDAVGIIHKHGVRGNNIVVLLDAVDVDGGPRVHLRAADAVHSVSLLLEFVIRTSRERIEVSVDRERAAHRRFARVRIRDRGPAEAFAWLQRGLIESSGGGLWTELLAQGDEEILAAAHRARAVGGDLCVRMSDQSDEREMQLLWPEVTA